jgi:hypothetical protein
MSRKISSDQRSPNISTEAFSGQPDRRELAFLAAIRPSLAFLTCILQVIWHPVAEGKQRLANFRID